jgi:hypothetical protein
MFRTGSRLVALALFASGTWACSDTVQAPSNTLTIKGAATAAPKAAATVSRTAAAYMPPDSGLPTGDPASMTIGLYALYISPNADCSSPVLVSDNGTTAVQKDFVQTPVLFTGSPAAGTYKCVMLKMSDVLHMKPATSFGPCVTGTEYAGDIYRDGETDWKDPQLNQVVGHGTDSLPVDDHVTIFMTRDTSAAYARGISPHQTIALGSDLIVPGQSTFYWNGQGSVWSEHGMCSLQPGQPEFK